MTVLRPFRRKNRKPDHARRNFIRSLPCAICVLTGTRQRSRTECAHVGLRGLGDRHALVEYVPVQRKKDGRYVWRRAECLNNKVRPNQVRGKVGSLQNVPLTIEECALWTFYRTTLIQASGTIVTQ